MCNDQESDGKISDGSRRLIFFVTHESPGGRCGGGRAREVSCHSHFHCVNDVMMTVRQETSSYSSYWLQLKLWST